jgi:glycine/D-amino acid oxidase-like deaminating enzyme/nitrite reductase/ring-hydroxylating ferredoxin subunit
MHWRRGKGAMNPELHGRIGSCWTATAPKTAYPKLDASANADVAIIGAGIVGLTSAILLAKAGLSVVVLEALTVGGQVTGRSTAKITTQHGLIYDHLIRTLRIESARRYAEANRAAVEQMKTWISEFEISCAYETKDAYVYCCDPTHIDALEAEAAASRRVGLDAELLAEAPLPFATTGALRCKDQAQFNPAQYLVGLARAAEAAGARIFEHSRVTSIEDDDGWRIKAGKATLNVSQAVQATNLPSWGAIPFDEYTRPRCHTAMAFRTRDTTVEGMFIGIDDHHSLRTGRDGEGDLLVVLGPKFDTGQEGQVSAYFLELEAWSRRNLNVDAAAWRWVNEDYDTADRIPYAGELKSAPGLYVATGFNAWGISNGTAAGMLIAKQLLGEIVDWAALYDPMRKAPANFNKGGGTQSLVHSVDDIERGEGKVISLGHGKIAVHKSMSGELHAVSASCTHKGCTVTWNDADHTWDCPCHGSMFAADGSVLHGPAVEPLEPKQLPPTWLAKAERSKRLL